MAHDQERIPEAVHQPAQEPDKSMGHADVFPRTATILAALTRGLRPRRGTPYIASEQPTTYHDFVLAAFACKYDTHPQLLVVTIAGALLIARLTMSADAALPEAVLQAITVIDAHLKSLPDDNPDRSPLTTQFGVFCSALIAFSHKYNLRYLFGG
jgi:hypothetical protein